MHELVKLQVPKGHVGIHWFEQNSYAIKDSHSTIVLIDPYFPHKRPPEVFVHTEPPLDESQLPINYVLLTHAHGDHTCSETLERINKYWPGAIYVGPKESIKQILEQTEIKESNTVTISAGESTEIGTMTAYAVYAKPPEGDPKAGIGKPDVTHLGYVVDADGIRLYFSGDEINTFADNDDLIKAVADLHPDIGFITNHPTEGEFPFIDGSIKMAQRIGLKTVVPAHYSCFVKRDYDPKQWAEKFPPDGPKPLIIPANSNIIYP
ncbi:TPA: MBL fold metallo-hydrolase [Candidatus Poribacteria bacterium]|nr:MBL fold metallo-hydrolase [Candidatus Poribacteria bacterium]